MPSSCSIRALWILNNQDTVVFSRRFSVIERRWSVACKKANERSEYTQDANLLSSYLPTDSELADAFADRKKREGSVRGYGIRVKQSIEGSDSWVDDPIMRHIISLHLKKEEDEKDHTFWPLILHTKGQYYILVLPLVEPHHLKSYKTLSTRSDCGNGVAVDENGNLSSLLLQLPSITGAFMVAHVLGDIITSDFQEPEVVVNAGPSVGGLLDSLTGSIGISARPKPVAAPVATSTNSTTASGGSDSPKIGPKNPEKDALRTFISTAMPFGTPLDLNYSNISTMRTNNFSSTDMPAVDSKQPAWKPYFFKGKQKLQFTIHETITASMYDRDEIPDTVSVSGQVNCRADLEHLPDILFPLTGLHPTKTQFLSFHPSAQIPEGHKQSVLFTPPPGNFVLLRYQTPCSLGVPVKGFYQLSMVSENEGAFLFKLGLMEGYKGNLGMEYCTVSMPFCGRKVVGVEGTPSVGSVSFSDGFVEWKIVVSGRGVGGKSFEASFPGTVRFAPLKSQRVVSSGIFGDEESDTEMDNNNNSNNNNNMVNVDEYLIEKMNKNLPAVDLEEPFSWQAYNYAKVSFKMVGASLSGMTVDPKSINIFPSVKVPVEYSTQVHSGDYILWNTLGKCPVAATPKEIGKN